MIKTNKNIILLITLALIAGAILYFEKEKPKRIVPKDTEIKLQSLSENGNKKVVLRNINDKIVKYSRAKEIASPHGFINTDKISISELIGKKVILVDFWTYSCINCQRTTPYLNSWYEKYKDAGLEIIGIHTPEFKFEEKYENVSEAVKKFGIHYPVVLDNDYGTWTAYANRYWPRKYLVDIDGFIVYDHIGEGFYAETEKKIQELLRERISVLGIKEEMAEKIANPKNVIEVDFSKVRSPETYFGSTRNQYLGNGKSGIAGIQNFSEPVNKIINKLYLAGRWNIQPEYAESQSQEAKIIFRYNAKNVYLVASADNETKMKIVRDGKLLFDSRGEDVLIKDETSIVSIKKDRLYKLIEDSDYGEHILEIIIENPGLRAFAFTFG